MRLKTVIIGAAATALATAPIVAQAAGADRAVAAIADENGMGGSDTLTRVLVLALIAGVIIGGIELFGDDEPASP